MSNSTEKAIRKIEDSIFELTNLKNDLMDEAYERVELNLSTEALVHYAKASLRTGMPVEDIIRGDITRYAEYILFEEKDGDL